MEQRKLGERRDYPGWEGFTLTHWRYQTAPKKGYPARTAEVLMLNPGNEQLARWVVNACIEAKGSPDARYTEKLCERIRDQSGGQFPVAGIVYEDMAGPFTIWGFRDGVTVGFQGTINDEPKQVTPEQIRASLERGTPLRYTGSFARLQGTTRDEYKHAGGSTNVEGAAFLDLNRRLYQAALGHDRNELMIAWAKANL
jgi:hypothetical protein